MMDGAHQTQHDLAANSHGLFLLADLEVMAFCGAASLEKDIHGVQNFPYVVLKFTVTSFFERWWVSHYRHPRPPVKFPTFTSDLGSISLGESSGRKSGLPCRHLSHHC